MVIVRYDLSTAPWVEDNAAGHALKKGLPEVVLVRKV